MALPRTEATGAFVGEATFLAAGCFGADTRFRVFGLRLRGAPVFLQDKSVARPGFRLAFRPGSQSPSSDAHHSSGANERNALSLVNVANEFWD